MSTPNKVGAALASAGRLTDIDTAQRNSLGLVVQGDDGGEYIYLKGVANTLVGSWVTYKQDSTTALLAHQAVGPVAVAMAAIVAGDFGWYCLRSGNAGVAGNCDTTLADQPVYIDGTSGRVDDASVAGDLVFGAFSRTADTTNVATFQINRPFVCNSAYLT